MTEHLKDCPFCGSKNLEVMSWGVVEYSGREEQDADVECQDCSASVSYTSKDPLNDSAEIGARNKWNTRINKCS